jgi:hypothetical protein
VDALDERFIHDGDLGRVGRISFSEVTAHAQRNPHRLQESGRDFPIVRPHHVAVFQLDRGIAAALERQPGGDHARRFHAWNGFDAPRQFAIIVGGLDGIVVFRRAPDLDRERLVNVEPRIGVQQIGKRPHQQRRPCQQR